jgi:hypothetical protein
VADFTVHVEGIGDVCSFALFDLEVRVRGPHHCWGGLIFLPFPYVYVYLSSATLL